MFVLQCADGPGLDMPVIMDPSGIYLRREGLGGHYLCGMCPKPVSRNCYVNVNILMKGITCDHYGQT